MKHVKQILAAVLVLALLAALAGLAVGFLPAWAYNRALTKKQGPEFTVVRRLS